MENSTIIAIIRNDPILSPYFRGCVFLDKFLTEANNYKDFSSCNIWIINTLPSGTATTEHEVGHFLFFGTMPVRFGDLRGIRPGSGSWFFDSFGKPVSYYASKLEDTLKNLSFYGNFQTNSHQLQTSTSNLCSLFSLYVALEFCKEPFAWMLVWNTC